MQKCLIVAGEPAHAGHYALMLNVLGYDSIIARSSAQAWGHLNEPLAAIVIVDLPSRLGEDMLRFVRQLPYPHRVPIVVAQVARYDEVLRAVPDYVVHADYAATQLRDVFEDIERIERERKVAEVGEEYRVAAE